MQRFTLGIDIGTTAVKVIVYDPSGVIVKEASEGHDLLSPNTGWAEEDASIWWENTCSIVKSIVQDIPSHQIVGIGVSGMVPTVILVDKNGNAIRPSIQQNDARAVAEIAHCRGKLDSQWYFEKSANTINQQLVFPKLQWLQKNEPENFAKTQYICGSYDLIANKLTGQVGVEANWALESGMWNPGTADWIDEICALAGISRKMLPEVQRVTDIRGTVTAEAAEKTGLTPGTPVISGCADHVSSAFSSGVKNDGDLLLKLGGAGDILYASRSYKPDRRLFLDLHPQEGYLLNGCMATSGSLVKWYTITFDLPGYEELTCEAEKIPLGSEGVVVLPYFLGEKSPIFDLNARGTITGLTLQHTRAHIFRAILESVAFGFRHHLDVLYDMSCSVQNVWFSNGGSRSDLWKQIIADVCGYDARYVRKHPGSALGAAVLAAAAVGLDENYTGLDRFLSSAEIIRFSPENHKKYELQYAVYRETYESLKPVFNNLARITGN